jgi:hypothetical protein
VTEGDIWTDSVEPNSAKTCRRGRARVPEARKHDLSSFLRIVCSPEFHRSVQTRLRGSVAAHLPNAETQEKVLESLN